MAVWARIPKARLATWTPDGALLVSVPSSGRIVKLTLGAPPQRSTLLEGLDQPRGMAFAGSTLYVAESDQIGAYDYADRRAIKRPDRRCRPSRRAQPPGGGPAAPFAAGVRHGTGLAVAPDGSLWTAINNRDDVPDPNGTSTSGTSMTTRPNRRPA